MDYSQVTVDILQNPKYAGAIDSVTWITNWIDSGFGMIITLVAFLIILVAMLKNVLAAAYCAYPNFWNHVADAHKEREATGWVQQLQDAKTNYKNINGGTISKFIYQFLPDIKSMTDFNENTFSSKEYFMTAIPQMLLCIIIGAFIYNGFYRDTAAVVVDFGSEMISRFLLEVDPVAAFDKFTGTSGRPQFASDDSIVPKTQMVNKVATTLYTRVIGTYKDITSAAAKNSLASAIENKAYAWVDELNALDPELTDGDSWNYNLTVKLLEGEPDISAINNAVSTDGLTRQYAMTFPVTDLQFSSTVNVGADVWVFCRLDFDKQAKQTGKHAVKDLILYIKGGNGSYTYSNVQAAGALRIKNTAKDYVATYTSDGTTRILEVSIDYTSAGDKTTQTLQVRATGNSSYEEGVYYKLDRALEVSDTVNNTTHQITHICLYSSDMTKDGTLYSPSENKWYSDFNCDSVGVATTGGTATPAPTSTSGVG